MRKEFHHGYLLTGDVDPAFKAALKMAAEILAVDERILPAHPDVKFYDSSRFLIDEAREIRDFSSKKSFSGRGRIFIIKANFFTPEAVNALLKTFEEPAGLSYFFVITSSPENILATLRSRLVSVKFGRSPKLAEAKEELIKKFLKSLPSKRIEMVKKIAEEKDKEKAADFFDGLELMLGEFARENFQSDLKEVIFSLDEIGKYRKLLFRKGSSPKMILEHLCLVLAKI